MKKDEEKTKEVIPEDVQVITAEVIHKDYATSPSENQLQAVNISSPEEMVRISKEVAKYVTTNALSVKIQGSDYVKVEGWQFTAGLLGLIGLIEDCVNESSYKEKTFKWTKYENGAAVQKKIDTQLYKYRAKAVFKNVGTGNVVGQGFAMCSNEETKKHVFEEYAIMSHAQTRAIGKAGRMAFAFVIKASGYEPTPAEEMDSVGEEKVKTTVALIPKPIVEKISKFTSTDKLLTWAGSDGTQKFHKNINFRNLIRAKQNEIIKTNMKENGKDKK